MFWNKHVWVSPITGERITSENVWGHRLSRKELLAQIAWADETNRALQNKVAKAEADNRGLCAVITRRDERIKELEHSLRKVPDCGTCPDAQRSYQESESWKERAEAAEKRYVECDAALKSASRMPPITRRKVWRVCGAKGMQLIVLDGAVNGKVTASEFWRAARKLGIPVDEVGNHTIERDVMVFQCEGHLASLPPGPSAIETSVYVIE